MFAVAGGLCVGFPVGYLLIHGYKHPITVLDTAPESNDPLLSEGERFVRGARIHIGPPSELMKTSEKLALEAGNKLKKEYLLPVNDSRRSYAL